MNTNQDAQPQNPSLANPIAVLPLIEDESADYHYFTKTLSAYRKIIDDRINEYTESSLSQIKSDYGQDSAQAYQAFLAILSRGGKRLRGALVMEAYYMFGGQNAQVAEQAALVMEIIQTYLLVIDDVCDRSDIRRGGPTAHILLAQAHQQAKWHDDSLHFGQSIAVTAAMLGLHQALIQADAIPVEAQAKLTALKNINHCLSVTAHGQFNDMYAEVKATSAREMVEQILIWKTAYYTFISPIQFGALLAGATMQQAELLTDYGIQAGQAFQLGDDLLGTFGTSQQTGKDPLDDIKEGKRTLLITLALQQASQSDAEFLTTMLGNQQLTPDQLHTCQQIIKDSGAYDEVKKRTHQNLIAARQALDRSAIKQVITTQGQSFLSGLLAYLENRHT